MMIRLARYILAAALLVLGPVTYAEQTAKTPGYGELEGTFSLSGAMWFDQFLYQNSPTNDNQIDIAQAENGQVIHTNIGRKLGSPSYYLRFGTNLRDRNLFTPNLNFNLEGNFRRSINNASIYSGPMGNRYLLESLSLDYTERYRERWKAAAGRVNLETIGGTAVDGAQLQWNLGPNSGFGFFGGLMPEPLEQKFSLDFRTAGIYVTKDFAPDFPISTLTASFMGQLHKDDIYRAILFFAAHANITDWMTLFNYLILDFYENATTTIRPTFGTVVFYLHPGPDYRANLSFSTYSAQPELQKLGYYYPPLEASQEKLIGITPDSSSYYRVSLHQSLRLFDYSYPFVRMTYRYHQFGNLPEAFSKTYSKIAHNPHQLYGQMGWKQNRFIISNLKTSVATGYQYDFRTTVIDVLVSTALRYLRKFETTLTPRVFFIQRSDVYSDQRLATDERETSFRIDFETRYELTDRHEFSFQYYLLGDRENINNRYSYNHLLRIQIMMRF